MPRPANTPDILWSKVNKKGIDDCWLWRGPKNAQGYGRVEINGKAFYVHRLIYALTYPGKIEWSAPKYRFSTGFLRHICDNPPCCNPNHLLVGTHMDNMRDKVERGRSKIWGLSINTPRAKLSADDVYWIRLHKQHGTTRRALALLYDVSVQVIKGVWSRRHYADI